MNAAAIIHSSRRMILLLFCLVCTAFPVFAGHHGEVNVLLLHSYHAELQWTADIETGLRKAFAAAGQAVNVHTEFLDAKRFQLNPEMQSHLDRLLSYKLNQLQFDLVILSDNDAFNFALNHRSDLLRDKPIVFCGVNGFTPKLIAGVSAITGVAESPQAAATLALARKFHPDLEEVIVVGSEKSVTGRLNYALFLALAPNFPALRFSYWNDLPLEILRERLATLGGGRILYLNSVISDRSGRIYSFEETADHLRDATTLPLYGSWDFFLGHGIVGGKLINGEAQGKMAAQQAIEILRGTRPEDLPVIFAEGASYLFDDRELRRFNIAASLLPKESEVRFGPSSIYKIDKKYLLASTVAFAILATTTILLVLNVLYRRRSEKALRSSQSLLKSFCDALPDLAFIVDEHGTFVKVLSANSELSYVNIDEITGRSLTEIFPPFMAALFQSKLDDALNAAGLIVFEYPLTVPAGEKYFEARIMPMPEIKEQARMLVWIARDITERRESEVHLEERARLADLEAEIGIALVEGRIMEATFDRCCAALIDYSGAVFGRFWDFNAADNDLQLKCSVGHSRHLDGAPARLSVDQLKIDDVIKGQRPYLTNAAERDALISDPDWMREQGIVAYAGFPLLVKGELVGAVALFFSEKVSKSTFEVIGSVMNKLAIGLARFHTEAQLLVALNDVSQSRERLDTILRSVADGLIVTDTANHVVMINRAAERLIGAMSSEVVGQSIEKVLSDTRILGGLTSVLLGEKPFLTIVVEMEGGERDQACAVEARIAPVRRKSGNYSGAVTILRDVTHEREIDRMKSEFVSIAAHELRTPLTTVLGYAELLLNEADTDGFDREQKREFLGYIYDKGEILKRIIDDMLDLGRIESRRPIILEKSDCEIVQLMRSTLEHLRKENPRYRFAMDCHTAGLVINIDQQKIIQVFDNVLSNAVKYSPAGGLIKVVGKVEGEVLLISVIDQGIGMTAGQMERAFDKFYRADSSDTAVGGLGLGLSICKNIVEAHGGKIWMESAPGEGTTVHFSLPLT